MVGNVVNKEYKTQQSWADYAVTPGGEDYHEVIERSTPMCSAQS
jgi:hypothetical protein